MEDVAELVPTYLDEQGREIEENKIKNNKAQEITDDAKQAAKDANDYAQSKGKEISESTKNVVESTRETAQDAGNWVANKGSELADDTKEALRDASDWTKNKTEELKDEYEKVDDSKVSDVWAASDNIAAQAEARQAEYADDRLAQYAKVTDPDLPAFERIKAAGIAVADGAMELTEAGRKKLAEFYADDDQDAVHG